MVSFFTGQPLAALLAVLGLGYLLGKASVRSLSLGPSAILFVAMAFGAAGVELPRVVGDLGIILFVYAVGLQAGPRFFRTFRKRGVPYAKLALVVTGSGAVLAWAAVRYLGMSPAIAIGMYTGAMTSTPGLAAALDTTRDPAVSVGYGLAYPFGVAGVVLFVQLVPRFLRARAAAEEERLTREEAGLRVGHRQFVVRNPNCAGRPLRELKLHALAAANLSRLKRGGKVLPITVETALEIGDVVVAVGRRMDLDKLQLILGEETEDASLMLSGQVESRNVLISSEEITGRPLAKLRLWERFGVTITRVRRDFMEFSPVGTFVLEMGDSVRAVGAPAAIDAFVKDSGQNERRIHETDMCALSLGMLLGVLVGLVPLQVPGGLTVKLGLSGGPLFAGLLLSHFGRIRSLSIRIPYAAKYILRELGLALFLAGAGVMAGRSAIPLLGGRGLVVVGMGALVTALPMLLGYVYARRRLGCDLLTTLGLICGGMTSTPALGAVSSSSSSERPALAYAAVYPVALIAVTVFAQLLATLL